MEIAQAVLSEKQTYETEYELERGKPMPSFNHSILQSRLTIALGRYPQYDIPTELSLELTSGKAAPDLCIYPETKHDFFHDHIRYKEPPLLTIEILSPKQSLDDLKDKIFNIYFPAGVKSCWIVVPTLKMIAVFTPDGEVQNYIGGIITDPALGVEVDMKEIFR